MTDLPTISVLTRRARECLDELFEAVVVSALTRRARERLDELFEAFVVAIARALACKLSATADTADVLFRSLVLEWTCTLSREVRVNFCAQREWTAAYDALIAPDAADGATTTAPTSSAAGDEPLAARVVTNFARPAVVLNRAGFPPVDRPLDGPASPLNGIIRQRGT